MTAVPGLVPKFNAVEDSLICWDVAQDPSNGALSVCTEIAEHPSPYDPPFYRSTNGGLMVVDFSKRFSRLWRPLLPRQQDHTPMRRSEELATVPAQSILWFGIRHPHPFSSD